MLDQKWAHHQVVQVTLQKRPYRVERRTNYGLFVHIEAGINEARYPAQFFVLLDDIVVTGINLSSY